MTISRKSKHFFDVQAFVKDIDADELKALIVEYFDETDHSNWEGYRLSEQKGVYAMFRDMSWYRAHQGVECKYCLCKFSRKELDNHMLTCAQVDNY